MPRLDSHCACWEVWDRMKGGIRAAVYSVRDKHLVHTDMLAFNIDEEEW